MLRSPSIARLANRALLSISGSQAAEFLNGILPSAIRSGPKRPTFSAILHAQGKVLCDIFLYTNTDEAGQQDFLIEYDSRPSDVPPLLPMLKKYVLRSKVNIRDVTEQYDVWASWGSPLDCPLDNLAREWQWAPSGAVEPIWNNTDGQWPWGSKDRTLFDRRAIGLGSRFLVKNRERPQRASTHDIKTPDDYTLHRILLGVPEGLIDIPPSHAFPMESNLDIMGGLDFRKGCYVGQELTVRTYHTGMIRKRILPVVIHDTDTTSPEDMVPNPSSPLHHFGIEIRPVVLKGNTPRPRGSGKLLTSVQGVGLALLRLEHVEGVMQGNLQLQIDTNGKMMAVSPRWPSWWPRQPVGSE